MRKNAQALIAPNRGRRITMLVEMRPIGSIRPDENNPRQNDAAVDAVAASIKEFGFRQPIVVDKEGTIVVGHTRYKVALKLTAASSEAVRTLLELMKPDVAASTRLGAARAILESGVKLREIAELEERLSALEEQLADSSAGGR
jgi:hypothetical protein